VLVEVVAAAFVVVPASLAEVPHPVATKAAVSMAKTQSRFTSHDPPNPDPEPTQGG